MLCIEICIIASLYTDQLYNAIKYHSRLKIKKKSRYWIICFIPFEHFIDYVGSYKSQIKAKHPECIQDILFNKLVGINGTFSPNDNLDTINTLKAETT